MGSVGTEGSDENVLNCLSRSCCEYMQVDERRRIRHLSVLIDVTWASWCPSPAGAGAMKVLPKGYGVYLHPAGVQRAAYNPEAAGDSQDERNG